jgi:hypothetical protein
MAATDHVAVAVAAAVAAAVATLVAFAILYCSEALRDLLSTAGVRVCTLPAAIGEHSGAAPLAPTDTLAAVVATATATTIEPEHAALRAPANIVDAQVAADDGLGMSRAEARCWLRSPIFQRELGRRSLEYQTQLRNWLDGGPRPIGGLW